MVQFAQMRSGSYVGAVVAEITAVPHFEALHSDPDHAFGINQVLFTQILTGLSRRVEPDHTAIELLWQSCPAGDQENAQVHQYLILRHMDADTQKIGQTLAELQESISADLTGKAYSLRFLEDDKEFDDFLKNLSETDVSNVIAVSKKERTLTNMFRQGGLYMTDVVKPAAAGNIADLTNLLAQCPNSTVSLQLIPTQYRQEEISSFEQGLKILSNPSTAVRPGQAHRSEATVQDATEAYESYVATKQEPLFYYNFLVYSQRGKAASLANRIIGCIEGGNTAPAMEMVDVSSCGLRPEKKMIITPWSVSDLLVYKMRQMQYWRQATAQREMIRMKYLITAREIAGIFQLPIDDGRIVGIAANKRPAAEVAQQQSPIPSAPAVSSGSFKLGRLLDNPAAQAGIEPDDLAKHTLIAGKSDFTLGLLNKLWQEQRIPFLAVEAASNDYRRLLDAIPGLQVFTPGKNQVSAFMVNPFLPPEGVTAESWIPGMTAAFQMAFAMPNPLTDIFQTVVGRCYAQYGWRPGSTAEDPNVQSFGMYEFIKVFRQYIRDLNSGNDVKAYLENAGVTRLLGLIEQNGILFDTIHSVPVADLLTRPTVIELSAIRSQEQKALVMALVLTAVSTYAKKNTAGDGKLKNILLLDEAHVLGAKLLEDALVQTRACGTGIILADRSPSKLGKGVPANTNVKIVLGLTEAEDRDAVSCGELGADEAVLCCEDRQLHFAAKDLQAQVRSAIPDQEIAEKMSYWSGHAELLVPYWECRCNSACQGLCSQCTGTEADYAASRIAAEYLHRVQDEREFLKFLVQMNPLVVRELKGNCDVRTLNCVKLKFLRKALLARSFRFSEKDYRTILGHPKFMKEEQ